ncbi:MAG: phage tail assembly chaperone family protein, TAC [Halomonas sp.]|uniref:phage tail assembly chaperone family protein, TAC n=1 Tax=Halomonas sp. TaxID=1486246 RepID=UPI003F8F4A49
MKLSIETLAANGGFVARKPVEKNINWQHEGQEFMATVNVLPLSYVTAKSDIQAVHAQGDVMAARIAHCIVGDDGAPVFTVEDVIGTAAEERGPLSAELTNELLRVISDVSGLGKRLANSTTKMKSGTSSSSTASVAGRSRKRKSASATPST